MVYQKSSNSSAGSSRMGGRLQSETWVLATSTSALALAAKPVSESEDIRCKQGERTRREREAGDL